MAKQSSNLNTGTTAKFAAAVGAFVVATSLRSAGLTVADPDEADQGRHQPADGRKEGESNNSLELGALIVTSQSDSVPVPDAAAGPVEPLFRVGISVK